MTDDEPRPNNPLSPYYPAETPSLPTPGRRWVAIVLLLTAMAGTLLWLVLQAVALI